LKISVKLILGLISIFAIISTAQYYQTNLSFQINQVSEYHDKMSTPALMILEQISTNSEMMHRTIHGYALHHEHSIEDYESTKQNVLNLINQYDELTYVQDSFGNNLAGHMMQKSMQDYVKQMLDLINEYDVISMSLFQDINDDSSIDIEKNFDLLDEKINLFRDILANDKLMELKGKTAQQNKINNFLEESNNLIFISNIIVIFLIVVIIVIITTSISSQISTLRKVTSEIAHGSYDVSFQSRSDEFQPLRDDIKKMSSDIKESKTLETDLRKKLIKKERFSAIGELSARIAHDIRNPLNVLKTSLDNIREANYDPEYIKKSTLRCNIAINRIAHQIDEVMDFLKDSPLTLEPVSFLELITTLKNDLDIPSGIKLKIPTNDVNILGDKMKLESLLYNLITNATQKLETTGNIIIDTSYDSDNMVKITVKDDGEDIPKDVLKKIFEPLYTTKQQGTGLGLASCKKIVEQHNGTISASNNPVTFTIIVPSAN
jgi:signal transduction histidine kinase